MPLPPSSQEWAHSVCTMASLQKALSSNTITAIETDLLMGRDTSQCKNDSEEEEDMFVPIMAHPPKRESDLSATRFLNMVVKGDDRQLEKHIKLDFKEMESVKPVLEECRHLNSNGKTIFLNADILPGPGRTERDLALSPDKFLAACLSAMTTEEAPCFALSLGFKVDVVHLFGYTDHQISRMTTLVERYHFMERSAGVVLAISARLLAKRLTAFDAFLERFAESQLLVWTARGEPPISERKYRRICGHFEARGMLARVGFDCKTCPFFPMGVLYDIAIFVLGLCKLVLRTAKAVSAKGKVKSQ